MSLLLPVRRKGLGLSPHPARRSGAYSKPPRRHYTPSLRRSESLSRRPGGEAWKVSRAAGLEARPEMLPERRRYQGMTEKLGTELLRRSRAIACLERRKGRVASERVEVAETALAFGEARGAVIAPNARRSRRPPSLVSELHCLQRPPPPFRGCRAGRFAAVHLASAV